MSSFALSRIDLRGQTLTAAQLRAALPRGGVDVDAVVPTVRPIVEDVADRGAPAALDYGLRFDGVRPAAVRVPAADLATALALASARLERPIPADLVAIGELGLGGVVRRTSQLERRLAEAARLGFARAIVPPGAPEPPLGIAVERVATLRDAIRAARIGPARRPPSEP